MLVLRYFVHAVVSEPSSECYSAEKAKEWEAPELNCARLMAPQWEDFVQVILQACQVLKADTEVMALSLGALLWTVEVVRSSQVCSEGGLSGYRNHHRHQQGTCLEEMIVRLVWCC